MTLRLCGRIAGILAVALALMVITMPRACAYIDPGTGSYVLQAAAATLLAAAFVVKTTWKNIVSAVSKAFSRRQPDEH